MKIVQINTFSYKATGSVMMNLHKLLLSQGVDSYVVWGRGRKPENDHEIDISDYFGTIYHGIYTRITDKTGFASERATKKLISRLREIQPDILHLHNIHGYYLNIEMLFTYIRNERLKVVWTLHDCWTFTGHCAFFDMAGCTKWVYGCQNCPQLSSYPASLMKDNSDWNYHRKKELFTGLDITAVTPCRWLGGLLQQSFLRDYPAEVIYNGIDRNVFLPAESSFRKEYGLEGKLMILGVASEWTPRKGLKDFIRLSGLLDEDYKIVLVGLSKKQIKVLPGTILALERTDHVRQLVEIYSAADIFFNPTYEDNFPTTNLEALACGTPVCTYPTGGSPESLTESCGILLKTGGVEEFAALLREKKKPKLGMAFDIDSAIKQFKKEDMLEHYQAIYKKIGERADGSKERAG